jgi:fucose 4-O-acetylase-like acetyltransferase
MKPPSGPVPGEPALRENWIDSARGISITLVVAGHNPGLMTEYPELAGVLASFRMPLFFAIVGTTLAGRLTLRSTLLRAAALVISYVVLCLASLALPLRRTDQESVAQTLLGILYGTGHTIAVPPLWFLPALALALLAALGIDALVARVMRQATAPSPATEAASALLAWVPGLLVLAALPPLQLHGSQHWGNVVHSGVWWNLDLVLIGTGFMFVGRGLRSVIQSQQRHEHRYPAVALGLAVLFALLYVAIRPRMDLNMRIVDPGPAALLVATVGCGAALFCIYLMRRSLPARLTAALGTSTLLILWLHAGIERRAWQALSPWLPAALAVAASIAVAVLVPYALDRLLARAPRLRLLVYPQPLLARLKRKEAKPGAVVAPAV